jgi:hypothetical protein
MCESRLSAEMLTGKELENGRKATAHGRDPPSYPFCCSANRYALHMQAHKCTNTHARVVHTDKHTRTRIQAHTSPSAHTPRSASDGGKELEEKAARSAFMALCSASKALCSA